MSPRVVEGGKVRRKRAQTPGRAYKEAGRLEHDPREDILHLDISEVKSGEGRVFVADDLQTCSSVILQAKQRGKRPMSVVWHAHPSHIVGYEDKAKDIEAEHPVLEYWDYRDNKYRWDNDPERRARFEEEFKEGLKREEGNLRKFTEQIPPKEVIRMIVEHLEGECPGAHIHATLIPGVERASTFNVPREIMQRGSRPGKSASILMEAGYADEVLARVLKEYQKAGRVQKVNRRCTEKSASGGAEEVHILPSGRIYRAMLKPRVKEGKKK